MEDAVVVAEEITLVRLVAEELEVKEKMVGQDIPYQVGVVAEVVVIA